MIEKVISGGQTGADQGGLIGARAVGLPTGGTAPIGFATENGNDPQLASTFGLVEVSSAETRAYKGNAKWGPRTLRNVKDADGTVIFDRAYAISGNETSLSPGSKLTLRHCKEENKPVLLYRGNFDELISFVADNGIKTLNVAGNREGKSSGIQMKVARIITRLILAINGV